MPYGYSPAKLTPVGEWAADGVYAAGGTVTRNGSTYWAKTAPDVGNDPEVNSPAQWQLLAQKGEPGTQGDPGTNGATWHSGSGAPDGGLGSDGDHYLDTDASDVYVKSGGSWSQTSNIKGPQGDQGAAGAGMEVGDVKWVAHGDVPAGWMECNGQALSTSEYPDLFAKIGYTHGGYSDTFNLPDLQDRVVLSRSGSRSISACGGEESHCLSTDEMPSHDHGGGEVSGYVDVSGSICGVAGFDLSCCAFCDSNATSCAITGVCGCDSYTNTMPVCGSFCGSGSFSGYVQGSSCGGSGAHNNMQPYLVLMAVIKVAA
jgi:microcystin-dependent protein